jgi:hypothetical protein
MPYDLFSPFKTTTFLDGYSQQISGKHDNKVMMFTISVAP